MPKTHMIPCDVIACILRVICWCCNALVVIKILLSELFFPETATNILVICILALLLISPLCWDYSLRNEQMKRRLTCGV